jgi:hypothetical protein
MSNEDDNPFLNPQGWILGDSNNPTFYPQGNQLVIGRNHMGANTFDLVWTEDSGSICYLEKVPYFPQTQPDGPPPCLFSASSVGYDPDGSEHFYKVLVVAAGGGQLFATVDETVTVGEHHHEQKTKASDGGSLAGLWGADAKPSVPMQKEAKPLKAVK